MTEGNTMQTRTLDGVPTTTMSVEFWSNPRPVDVATLAAADLTPGEVIPVLAIVRVGPITHTPGDHDEMHRANQLEVRKFVIPFGPGRAAFMKLMASAGAADDVTPSEQAGQALEEHAAAYLAAADEFDKATHMAWARANVPAAQWADALVAAQKPAAQKPAAATRTVAATIVEVPPPPPTPFDENEIEHELDEPDSEPEVAVLRAPDDDLDFQLPPPAPALAGEVTLRQIVPTDPRLRRFVADDS